MVSGRVDKNGRKPVRTRQLSSPNHQLSSSDEEFDDRQRGDQVSAPQQSSKKSGLPPTSRRFGHQSRSLTNNRGVTAPFMPQFEKDSTATTTSILQLPTTPLSSLPRFSKKKERQPHGSGHVGLADDGSPVKSDSTPSSRSDRRPPKRCASRTLKKDDSDDDFEIAPARTQSPSKKQKSVGSASALLSLIETNQNPSEATSESSNARRQQAELKLPFSHTVQRRNDRSVRSGKAEDLELSGQSNSVEKEYHPLAPSGPRQTA